VAGRDSLLIYTLRTFNRRRRDYANDQDDRWLRLRSAAEIEKFEATLNSPG
jgi:hypothetical protein